jgi:hypothetical protein
MKNNNEQNNLDSFFEVIDSIEDDISEMLENENSELSGYECLIISINCLTLFCQQIGINFSQIEDHYSESEKSRPYEDLKGFDSDSNLKKYNEVEAFNMVLDEMENTLFLFEKRCKKTEELFDEWNCVFIMFSCLRKYCNQMKFNYGEIIEDVLRLQSNMEKDAEAGSDDANNLN